MRVWRKGAASTQEGRFVRLTSDSLIVQTGFCCALDTVQLTAIRELAVSRGLRRDVSRMTLGAIWGGAVGAGAGVVVTQLGCRSSGNELCAAGITVWVPVLALAGAAVGALLSSAKIEQWERIFPVNGAAIFVTPYRHRGVAISATLPLQN